MPENLNDYYKNIYSQRGEDGIIEEICRRIGLERDFCVEFGAGDGISISNTKNLIDKGWSAFLIESDKFLYEKCIRIHQDNSKVICLNTAVDCGHNCIDNLISRHFYSTGETYEIGPIKPSIMSIDIDGIDFEVFKSIEKFFPDLIIVECNPYRYPLDKVYHGHVPDLQQSLYIFNEEAKRKNYTVICYTQNIFLIKDEYSHLFDPPDLMTMFINGFIRSFHLETDSQEKYRIFDRIRNKFHLNNEWLKEIIEGYCND